eukprot:TRINITY_DN1578_c2_g1_i1.p2 TRINITY_DN1578_c2_g1~~TRINITY_DN1578_c2_g1_i1.p2  ORF type:complete len:263 (+),score=107.60 TRINITY_DN1578_c2_g1_i1:83-871(+)
MLRSAGLALLLCATAAAGEGAVTQLTSANFKQEVTASGKNAFVKFFAPWCGHCKSMAPAWEELAGEYAGSPNVVIGEVDCTSDDGKDLCEQFGVGGYPTLKYFTKETGDKGEDFQGARELNSFKEFVEENLAGPDPFTILTSVEEFTAWTQADSKPLVLGLFRTPTIGALYTGWKGAARKHREECSFGVYAQSRYNAADRKYTKSPLEEQLKGSAPAVLISTDKGATWSKCKVPSRTSTTNQQRIDAIHACATKGEELKPLK